jgi:hypothetical protein
MLEVMTYNTPKPNITTTEAFTFGFIWTFHSRQTGMIAKVQSVMIDRAATA